MISIVSIVEKLRLEGPGTVMALAAVGLVWLVVDASPAPGPVPAAREAAAVERGRYLVHEVAMCVQCHTPRLENGALDSTNLLRGAPNPFEAPYTDRPWAVQSINIAGLPAGWNAEDLAHFLQTGETPRGDSPRPPMPPFRMNAADARDVAAYLQSLRSGQEVP